MRNGRIKRS